MKPPEIAALSCPRGKRQVVAVRRAWWRGALTPGDPLFEPGVENILVSSSTNQARIVPSSSPARRLGEVGKVTGGVQRWRSPSSESRARVQNNFQSDARRSLGPWRERFGLLIAG